jgi:hypothetical protein
LGSFIEELGIGSAHIETTESPSGQGTAKEEGESKAASG